MCVLPSVKSLDLFGNFTSILFCILLMGSDVWGMKIKVFLINPIPLWSVVIDVVVILLLLLSLSSKSPGTTFSIHCAPAGGECVCSGGFKLIDLLKY